MLQKTREFSRLRGNDRSGRWSVARRRIPCDVPDFGVLEVLNLVSTSEVFQPPKALTPSPSPRGRGWPRAATITGTYSLS